MIAWLVLTMITAAGAAQDHQHAGLTRRGEAVMGFDQTATTHHFRLAPDGGQIEVTVNDPKDSSSIGQIRMHLQHIAKMFTGGDFTAPMLIHAKEPPGVKTMKQGGDQITYSFEEIERGGVVKISTSSPKLRDAVQAFLRFQIKDHRTGDPVIPRIP
jgi:hypothetical protein